jgi:PIN domain-containing protein
LILYAETSAVLAWLLGQDAGQDVGRELARADCVVASELTWIEVDRLLHRYEATGKLERVQAARLRKRFAATAAAWEVLELGSDVLTRARGRFPVEPVRTLDVLHLSSALVWHEAERNLEFLSLDRRCRANARELGFHLLPTLAEELREPEMCWPARPRRPRSGASRARAR